MQTRSPIQPFPAPSSPGRLQLLPPTLIVAEHVEGCILTHSDMCQFAEFLANEFEHDRDRALWQPSYWYQEQVGFEICSEKEAMLLREMTVERCGKLDAMRELLAKADAEAVPWWVRHGPLLSDVIGFGLAVGLILLAVVFGYTDGPQ